MDLTHLLKIKSIENKEEQEKYEHYYEIQII
jgi:hypothetical protein